MKPTFKQQFDNVMRAYLKNEIIADNPCACFIGNLLNHNSLWCSRDVEEKDGRNIGYKEHSDHTDGTFKAIQTIEDESDGLYTHQDIMDIEWEFMKWASKMEYTNRTAFSLERSTMTYEDRLYRGIEAALLKLREVHERHGEVIEDYVVQKRVLA